MNHIHSFFTTHILLNIKLVLAFLNLGSKHSLLFYTLSELSAFIICTNKFNFSSDYLISLQSNRALPVVLDWAIGNETCDVAQTKVNYVCKRWCHIEESARTPMKAVSLRALFLESARSWIEYNLSLLGPCKGVCLVILSFTTKLSVVNLNQQLLSLQNLWMDKRLVAAFGQWRILDNLKFEFEVVWNVEKTVCEIYRPMPLPTVTSLLPW